MEGPEGLLTGRAVQRRRLALLALLAPARHRGMTRDRLVAYLWPDADPDRARRLLSDSVYRINRALEGGAVLSAGDVLRLNPEKLSCDLWDFADAMESGDRAGAVQLGGGPFLDGFFLPDSGEFDRWADAEREALRRERAGALEILARDAAERSDHAEAVRWWRMSAAADPYSSRVALELMRSLDRAGDRPAAVRHARVHATLVRDTLEVEPDSEVMALARRLQAARSAPPRVEAPPSMPETGPHSGPKSTPGQMGWTGEHAEVDRPGSEEQAPTDGAPERTARPGPGPAAASPHGSGNLTGPRPQPRLLVAMGFLTAAVLAWALLSNRSSSDQGPLEPASPTSVAVLPFEDLSPDGLEAYLADGITEELLLRLSRVDGLDIVGRTSSFAFRGRDADIGEVASRLGVQAVLGGSVLRSGDRLRVFAQLTDANTGYQLWSERYDRAEQDVFAIQDEIAEAIVTRLRGRLAGSVGGTSAYATVHDPEAYNLYLRGRFEWHKRSEEGLRNAITYFREATERQPDYARAFAGLGDAYAVLGFYDHLPPDEAFPRAMDAAHRALEIDPALAGPHATLGYAALYYEWDWERARAELRRAIELDPGHSTGRQWYANFLTAMGAFDAAVREMRAAQDLDPLSLIANAALGWILFHAADFDAAIHQLERTLELDSTFEVAMVYRALSYAELGRFEEALAGARRAIEVSGASSASLALLARTHALAGDGDSAGRILEEIETLDRDGVYIPSYEMATVLEALVQPDRALDWLERAYTERSHSMVFLAVDPRLEGLRDHPRFVTLVRRVGLDRTPEHPDAAAP